MTRDQLNLSVGESARGEKGEHLVPKQMRVHRLRDARSMAILLYDLLDAARSERAAAPGLKEIAVARIGPQVALQDQAEAGWKQNVAILGSLAMVNENLRLVQVDIAGLDSHQLAHPQGGVEKQFQ